MPKLPKFVRYTIAMIFCFTLLAVAVYAFEGRGMVSATPIWQDDMYSVLVLNSRQQGLDIRGQVPEILENFGPAYDNLNMEIENAVEALVEGTRRIRARSVTFDYEIYYANNVVSIIISATAQAVTSRTSVMSVNFNPRTGALVTLPQAVGQAMGRTSGLDITPLAEGKIAEMIRLDPATYYAAFNATPTGQGFYLTSTSLHLLFDEFQLSSVPGATTQIVFDIANIRVFTLSSSSYRISPDRYEVKMMPVRTTLEGLGYTVVWNGATREATISYEERVIIVLQAGVNNYQLNGVLQRTLEAPPTMFNGHMYVPLSFFDQVLNLTSFTVDAQGTIRFVSYLGHW